MVLVGLIVLVSFVSVIFLVSTKSVKMAKNSASELAQSMAGQYGNEVKTEIEVAMDTARVMSNSLGGLKASGNANRDLANSILIKVVEDNPKFLGVWACFEPNMFDGKDAQYVNTKGTDATGRYIPYWNRGSGSIAVDPLVDYEVSGAGDFYQLPKASHEETVLNPYSYKIGGKDVLLTSLVVPIMDQGQFIGVAGIDIALDKMQEIVSAIKPFETGYATLISNTGLYVGHKNKDLLGKVVDNEAVKKAIAAGEKYNYTVDGYQHFYAPITIGRTTTPWSFEVSIPLDKAQEQANSIRNFSIFAAAIAIAIIILVLFLIANSITKPILQTTALLKNISEGEGDLTKRIEITTKDELGDLGKYFNKFIGDIHGIVKHIRENADQVAGAAQELSSSSEGAQKTVQQVAEAIQEMAKGASEQATKAESVSNMVGEIAEQINSNDSRVETIKGGSELTLSLVEDGLHAISEQNQKMKENMDATMNVAKAIDDLSIQIQEVGHILETISSIANQTNLLALNAAIEAARAGEHGRGFAVVAEEVRKLAEESAQSAGEIGRIVSKIQSGAKGAVEEMGTARAIVNSQKESADKTNNVFNKISEAVHNMVVNIKEIADASVHINRNTGNIADATGSIAAVAEENAASSEEVSASSEEQSAAVQEIAASAESLTQLGEELRRTITKFKL
jgi:methyl-accepting chemotaxis protein